MQVRLFCLLSSSDMWAATCRNLCAERKLACNRAQNLYGAEANMKKSLMSVIESLWWTNAKKKQLNATNKLHFGISGEWINNVKCKMIIGIWVESMWCVCARAAPNWLRSMLMQILKEIFLIPNFNSPKPAIMWYNGSITRDKNSRREEFVFLCKLHSEYLAESSSLKSAE